MLASLIAKILIGVAVLTGVFVLLTFPAYPRTWIGLALAVVGLPLMLLGEVAGDLLLLGEPTDPGKRLSIRRITWLLRRILLCASVLALILYVQSRFLGNPLERFERVVERHYR